MVKLISGLFALLPSVVMAAASVSPPAAPREFRAAWVATVSNIDWPSKKGLPVEEQKREILAILDRAVELKLNCLIVQVRTTADALYPSNLEPWSVYLTGEQGVAPSPAYDPLAMWIEEGHKRGIEIHAWFNPYRARMDDLPLTPSHISQRKPNLVKTYGKYLWLDPGEPEAAAHSLAVFSDVIKRYDVDGIHIDDYFYPYPIKGKDGKDLPFPDDVSWNRYKRAHPVKPNPATAPADVERVARDDWRRQNVNQLIQEIYRTTKKLKPWVKFGISPFGIGRPRTAPGITGFDQYEKLYADATLWLQQGWCDYFTPQLYWPIAQKPQSFPVLYDYWRSENKQKRHVWPGMFTSRVGDKSRPFPPGEIADQILVTRERRDNPGHVHFSMTALMTEREGLFSDLITRAYTEDAIVPASPWLDSQPPPKPAVRVTKRGDQVVLQVTPSASERPWQFAVWRRVGDRWEFDVLPGATRTARLPAEVTQVVVTSVDRCGNESERVTANVK